MLDQLRRQTKVVLWVVVVGFVGFMFFDWGMNRIRPGSARAGLAGKVGKDRITLEEFRQEYRKKTSCRPTTRCFLKYRTILRPS
jgi:hypothetical protein